jgi:hypothetical protein
MSAMIFSLKKSQEVLVAGAADSRIIRLPSDKEQMSEFLSGPSPTLLCNYVVRQRYAFFDHPMCKKRGVISATMRFSNIKYAFS